MMDCIHKYIIYALIDPDSNKIRYIGKSMSGLKRAYEHTKPSNIKVDGNTPKANWIRKLKENNKKYIVDVLFILDGSNLDKFQINTILYKKEQELIDLYRKEGLDLTNRQDGGPGSPNRKISEETKLKMSKSAKKRGLNQFLLEQQKPKFNDPVGKRICSKCLEHKDFSNFKKSNKRLNRICKSCYNMLFGEIIKLKKRKNTTNHKSPVIAIKDTAILEFDGIIDAIKFLGGKSNKNGIRNAINNNKNYYNYQWYRR